MILGSTNRIIFKPAAPSPVKLLLNKYEGAAAAYSLRLLNANYSGPAINVRHTGEGNPSQLIYFKNGELDTETLINFCGNHDGYITRWYDQSGNQNDATQTTASNQPKIYDKNEGIELTEGKPSINFEVINSTPYLNANFINFETAFTVVKTETIGVYNYLLYDSVNNLGIGHNAGTINKSLFYYDSTSVKSLPNPDTNRHLGFFDNINLTVKIGKDGENSISFNTIKNFSMDSISRNLLSTQGQIQEIILYSSTQSSNRTAIENNINQHYKIY